jgi:hypothetical protein
MSTDIDTFTLVAEPVKTRNKTVAKKRVVAEIEELAGQLAKADLDALLSAAHAGVRAISEGSETESVSPLTGEPLASSEAVTGAYLTHLLNGFRLRHQALKHTIGSEDVSKMLGAEARQTANDRARGKTLIAVKDRGALRFPLWQFDAEGPDGVVEGLPQVLKALRIRSPLGRLIWFISPKQQLGGQPPIKALKDGHLDAVLAEARAAQVG